MSDDAAILGSLVDILYGTCRSCGCHGDSCSLREGDRCVWIDANRTLCSNPACVIAADRAKKKYKREQQRGPVRVKATWPRRKQAKKKLKGRVA